jgi:hypothetical protein
MAHNLKTVLAALALTLGMGLSACSPNVPIARFQLVNQTPFTITHFSVAETQGMVLAAPNFLSEPLAANSAADADVAGFGSYWLRATATVDGAPVEIVRGPVLMTGGTVAWSWSMRGNEIVEGTDAAAVLGQTDLPILVIDTRGEAIPDEPKIPATLRVIDNEDGFANRPILTGDSFSTPVALERRGFSTQLFPKASWGMEIRDEVGEDADAELLGMPSEEDWVLYGPWMDRSLIRNAFGYELWGALGWYAPRTRFCEVYLHDDPSAPLHASYEGVYVLTEKVKRDKNRIDIAKLGLEDNADPEIAGGT